MGLKEIIARIEQEGIDEDLFDDPLFKEKEVSDAFAKLMSKKAESIATIRALHQQQEEKEIKHGTC